MLVMQGELQTEAEFDTFTETYGTVLDKIKRTPIVDSDEVTKHCCMMSTDDSCHGLRLKCGFIGTGSARPHWRHGHWIGGL